MNAAGDPAEPADEVQGLRTIVSAAPSIDRQLATNTISLLDTFLECGVEAEAKGLTYGRDTLISSRERSELMRALRRAPDQRQPSHLSLIDDLMMRYELLPPFFTLEVSVHWGLHAALRISMAVHKPCFGDAGPGYSAASSGY